MEPYETLRCNRTSAPTPEAMSARLATKVTGSTSCGPPLLGSVVAVAVGLAASNRRSTPLPLGGSEDGTNDMTNLLLVNIVREMRSVPDHHILVEGTLSVDEATDLSWSIQL